MALVVDTSVWVDYFNGRETQQTDRLHHILGQEEVIIGDLILTILQGFRLGADFYQARELLRAFPVVSMLGPDMAIKSAGNCRILREHSAAIRNPVNIMIATWCIEHDLPLLYSDRDFDPAVHHLGLQIPAEG